MAAKQHLLRLAGPVAGALVYLWCGHLGQAPAAMAGVVAWMAIWWIGEAVPLAVTSLLPMVLFPLFGIDTMAGTAANYGKETIYLFLGGFLLALAVERSGLHQRIALRVMARVGGSGPRILAGMMIATSLLSIWVNSTSCVLVMLPIALSIVDGEGDPDLRRRLTVPLLLAVAYAATIGGFATPVSTPPNLVFTELWRERWPDRPPIGFGRWMMTGIPLMVVYTTIGWWLLTKVLFRVPKAVLSTPEQVRARLQALGPVSAAERTVALIFGLTALLWVTGDDIPFGSEWTWHGWRVRTGLTAFTDGPVALLGAILLFVVPARGEGLMTWRYAEERVPWGVLLIIGAGFAIGSGIGRSGLAAVLMEAMGGWRDLPQWSLVGAVSTTVCLLSELGSNTATASLSLPILAESAEAWGMDPERLLFPATLAATLGFSLPVASPMLAIVFGTGRIRVAEMVRAGVVMDVVGIALLVLFFGLG